MESSNKVQRCGKQDGQTGEAASLGCLSVVGNRAANGGKRVKGEGVGSGGGKRVNGERCERWGWRRVTGEGAGGGMNIYMRSLSGGNDGGPGRGKWRQRVEGGAEERKENRSPSEKG